MEPYIRRACGGILEIVHLALGQFPFGNCSDSNWCISFPRRGFEPLPVAESIDWNAEKIVEASAKFAGVCCGRTGKLSDCWKVSHPGQKDLVCLAQLVDVS